VTEIERRDSGMYEAKIDGLLRQSMSAAMPSLPADFDQRVMREVRRSSAGLDLFGRIVLGGYGLLSVAVCAAVMRGQGLEWGPIAGMILGPLAVVAVVPWVRRAGHKPT
jgi:hypothetical protein